MKNLGIPKKKTTVAKSSDAKNRKNLQSLTVQDVCELLQTDRHTVYDLIYAGEIQAFKLNEKSNSPFRITEQALEDFITKNHIR